LHYVRTHPGTIAERNLISAKLARLCGEEIVEHIESKQKRLKSPHENDDNAKRRIPTSMLSSSYHPTSDNYAVHPDGKKQK
jgi:hypothetical protein